MAGQVSRQMRKRSEEGCVGVRVRGGCLLLSPVVSVLASSAVSVAVCGVFLIRPVSADTQQTVPQPCMAHSPPTSQLLSL